MPNLRILVLAGQPPTPAGGGSSIRTYSLVTAWRNAGHEVSVHAIGDPPRSGVLTVPSEYWPPRNLKRFSQRIGTVFSVIPDDVRRCSNEGLGASLRALRQGSFDLIVCNQPQMGAYLPDLDNVGARTVLDEHNVEHRLLAHLATRRRSPIGRLHLAVDAARLRKVEMRLWSEFDTVAAVSAVDAQRISDLAPAANVFVAPNGVDVTRLDYGKRHPRARSILFTGTMSWPPNRDAALFLSAKVLPILRRLPGCAELWVVGRDAATLRQALGPDVIIHSDVLDTAPYFLASSVFVVPLRTGGGTRLKVLEAMAFGLPVVATPLAVEGLGLTAGREYLSAETASEFARQVTRLWADPLLARRIAAAARERCVRHFDWALIAAEYLRSAMGSAEGGATSEHISRRQD